MICDEMHVLLSDVRTNVYIYKPRCTVIQDIKFKALIYCSVLYQTLDFHSPLAGLGCKNITMHPKLLEVVKSGESLGIFVFPSIKAAFKCFIVFWKQYTDSSLTTEVAIGPTYDSTYYTLV